MSVPLGVRVLQAPGQPGQAEILTSCVIGVTHSSECQFAPKEPTDRARQAGQVAQHRAAQALPLSDHYPKEGGRVGGQPAPERWRGREAAGEGCRAGGPSGALAFRCVFCGGVGWSCPELTDPGRGQLEERSCWPWSGHLPRLWGIAQQLTVTIGSGRAGGGIQGEELEGPRTLAKALGKGDVLPRGSVVEGAGRRNLPTWCDHLTSHHRPCQGPGLL